MMMTVMLMVKKRMTGALFSWVAPYTSTRWDTRRDRPRKMETYLVMTVGC